MPFPMVILAAGMGSRYGGDKQLAAVGPGGETLADYVVFDALRAGCDEIVLVIRDGMQPALDVALGARFRDRAAIRYVPQRLEDVPDPRRSARRVKPWGTGQAVLAAARTLNRPFAVANADDFYGRDAIAAVGRFLETPPADDVFALAGFPLAATLSGSGGVNRGICEVGDDRWLRGVREVIGLERDGAGARWRDGDGRTHHVAGDAIVSMSLWAFTPVITAALAARFAAFLDAHAGDPDAEFLLPDVVGSMMAAGDARVRVLAGDFQWCGVTHPDDRAEVVRRLADLTADGVYPSPLK